MRFFRDVEGREVDFVPTKAGTPLRFVECKLAATVVNPALLYLRGKFPEIEAVQVIATGVVDRIGRQGVRVVSADQFLAELLV